MSAVAVVVILLVVVGVAVYANNRIKANKAIKYPTQGVKDVEGGKKQGGKIP